MIVVFLQLCPGTSYTTKLLLRSISERIHISNFRNIKVPYINLALKGHGHDLGKIYLSVFNVYNVSVRNI